ncbi:MAG: DUF695 domain-containing protein [Tepidisphaeraceae bacterium]
MPNTPESDSLEWVTTLTEHEGAPLALRVRPHANTPENRKQYGLRIAVVHELAEVRTDGLPTPKYNDSLSAFDHELHQCVEDGGEGLVVIVETLGGQRVYFSYAQSDAKIDIKLNKLAEKYPQHTLKIVARPDNKWEAYEHYRALFRW